MQHNNLATLLATKYDSDDAQYLSKIEHQQDEIIKLCGGLHNLLQLYLCNNIDEHNVSQLHSLFTANENATNILQIDHNAAENHLPSVYQQRDLLVPEILKVDVDDNLYFRILKSKEKANHILHNIIESKYMNIAICTLVLLSIIGMVCAFTVKKKIRTVLWIIWTGPIAWAFILYPLLHFLGFNIQIMRETVKTFDFGYKVYQLIVLLITFPSLLYEFGNTIYDIILMEIMFIVVCMLVFFVDAWSMKQKYKQILIGTAIVLCVIMTVYTYVKFDDILWDPFNGIFGAVLGWNEDKILEIFSSVTLISFKSATINAQINIILLLIKSFLSGTIGKYLNKKTLMLIDDGCVKSVSLLNRPYIKWINFYDDKTLHSQAVVSIGFQKIEQKDDENDDNLDNTDGIQEMDIDTKQVRMMQVGPDDIASDHDRDFLKPTEDDSEWISN